MNPIQPIKVRKAEMSKRGIYVQDKELLQTEFLMGTHFDFVTHSELKQVVIVPSTTNLKNTVSKRAMKGYVKPVIDIRKKDVLAVFDGCSELQVAIYPTYIVIQGIEPQVQATVEMEVVIDATLNAN